MLDTQERIKCEDRNNSSYFRQLTACDQETSVESLSCGLQVK